jgi:metal-responsive CopG/Arc/MetJ family transcriptional regulator
MKLSVSIDSSLAGFMTAYQAKAGLKTRSAVVEQAVRFLAEREAEAELAQAYAASAAQDIAMAQEAQAIDNDGLSHEAW